DVSSSLGKVLILRAPYNQFYVQDTGPNPNQISTLKWNMGNDQIGLQFLSIDNPCQPGNPTLPETDCPASTIATPFTINLDYATGSFGNVTLRATSDARLKTIIGRIPNAGDIVDQLNGYYFTWNRGKDQTARHVGVIAQEVEAVLPELVRKRG